MVDRISSQKIKNSCDLLLFIILKYPVPHVGALFRQCRTQIRKNPHSQFLMIFLGSVFCITSISRLISF